MSQVYENIKLKKKQVFLNEQKLLRAWKRLFPPQRSVLYAKIWIFLSILFYKTVSNLSIMSGELRREQPFSYTEWFLFVLSFDVAPYFQLKKLAFLYNFWTFLNQCIFI